MISVVMATYNGENFIKEQLQSIYDQTLQPDEVLISDDRSTDSTVQIVNDFISRNGLSDKWTITVNDKNKGFFKNFMDTAFEAHGDTIYFADQDDIWATRKIEELEKYLAIPDVMMAQSDMIQIDENGEQLQNDSPYHDIKGNGTMEIPIEALCRFAGLGLTMGMKTAVLNYIKKNRLYREVFWAHDLLCALSAESIGRVMYDKDVIDKHRLHNSNVTEKKGRHPAAGRTRNNQLEIVTRKTGYFRLLAQACRDENKKNVFESFSFFSFQREKYINKFSLAKFGWLLKRKDMYLSKYGLWSDTLYSLGLEKVVMKVLG